MSLTRRQILRGAAGFSLALPFLPSLLRPREARADVPTTKRFVHFCTQHGGVWGANMFPGDATLTEQMSYANRTIKRGALSPTINGADAVLSNVLRASSSVLTPALAAKMNVLRGLDVPFYLGHNTGLLGNFARNDGNGAEGRIAQATPTATIDQRMAWSSSFYGDLATIRERVLVVGNRHSWTWANPQQKSGPIQEVGGTNDAVALFKKIFVPADDHTRSLPPVVDRVFEDYSRLRKSNTRLSSDDKRRLDDHMQRLSELERRLKISVSCSNIVPVTTDTIAMLQQASYGTDPSAQAKLYSLFNDVIVAAIHCDTSRIAVVNLGDTFSSFAGDWHQDVAHQTQLPDGVAQKVNADAHQIVFEKVFLDLVTKLDTDDGTGRTYLDNSLVSWTQEFGEVTHTASGMPVITAGSAGGFLKTGSYCDYRDKAILVDAPCDSKPESCIEINPAVRVYGGLLWHQWLGTALQAMGLPRAEYEQDGVNGYPNSALTMFGGKPAPDLYPDVLRSVAGEVLPFLKA